MLSKSESELEIEMWGKAQTRAGQQSQWYYDSRTLQLFQPEHGCNFLSLPVDINMSDFQYLNGTAELYSPCHF